MSTYRCLLRGCSIASVCQKDTTVSPSMGAGGAGLLTSHEEPRPHELSHEKIQPLDVCAEKPGKLLVVELCLSKKLHMIYLRNHVRVTNQMANTMRM